MTVTGADAQNYNVTTTNANLIISPKAISAIYVASNKVQDGNTKAKVTGSLVGVVSGDVVSVSNQDANFDSAAVGIGKKVTVTGVKLNASSDASNYTLGGQTTATATASITSNGPDVVVKPLIPNNTKNPTSKVLTSGGPPFELAEVEFAQEDICATEAVSSGKCTCEEGVIPGVKICYENK